MSEAVGVHAADDRQVVDALGQAGIKVRNRRSPPGHAARTCATTPRASRDCGPLRTGSLSSVGIGLPWCLISSGLGSKVSTWLTPPYMNRTMHALALAGKWGRLGARGESVDRIGLRRGGRSREEPIVRQQRGAGPSRQSRRLLPRETRGECDRTGQGPIRSCCPCRSWSLSARSDCHVNCCKQTRSCSKRPGKTPRGPCGVRRRDSGFLIRLADVDLDLTLLLREKLESRTELIGPRRPTQASANARSTCLRFVWAGLGDQTRREMPRPARG